MWSVLHVGLGPLGRRIACELGERGLGRVTAAVDVDPALAGRPLAELVRGAEAGVSVASDLGAVRGSFDGAIVTTSSDLARCADTFRALLLRGLAVVTTCEEAVWPRLRHPELADELDALAREHGGRLLGTGVNPGLLMDTLPAALSAACRSVRRLDVWRVQDATTRREPFQRKIGATLDDAAFAARVEDGSLRHVGLGESLHFAADALGLALERWDETLEPVRAERDLACDLGPIPAGRIAGVRQVAQGWRGAGQVARLEFVAAIGQREPHDRVRLEGEPTLDVRIEGGVHGDDATCAIAVNALRSLRAAPPGFHTMATVPLVTIAVAGR